MSNVDYTECERILRKKYSIPDDEDLIWTKVDYYNTTHNNTINFLLFNKLDLNLCNVSKIKVQLPMRIELNLTTAKKFWDKKLVDIFNPKDPFFNDICFGYFDK